jgi:hypothetical protein
MLDRIPKLIQLGWFLDSDRWRRMSKMQAPSANSAKTGGIPLLITRLLPQNVTRTITSVLTLTMLYHSQV